MASDGFGLIPKMYGVLWPAIQRKKSIDDDTYQAQIGDFFVQEHEGTRTAMLYVDSKRVWPRFHLVLHDEFGDVWKTVEVPETDYSTLWG